MNKVKTILFDFDGTIMNSNDLVIKSWQHTFKTVEGKERPVETIIRTFGEPLFITMEKMLPEVPVEEGVEIYRSYLREHFSEMIKPFPGMVELVQQLKDLSYTTGLVTSRPKNTTFEGLEKFKLLPYLDCVISCDDTDKHKPDPEPLLVAMKKLYTKPEKSIMLGDTKFDILCARNAGVRSVLVGWQMALTEEEIKGPEGPDFMIKKPDDLLELLIKEHKENK